ncbi:MerR family transcriptional regulator [Proteiniclasticum ruminis]|uniref:DNA-binding transcriptional regulator, MerR family n=1 Tax=Proteiniclasticum ruminis TaxID=398199 RepID=A0A1I5DYX5_9CLOT|nr:MerR family transcriptional regulator [Proteiniclasticum ruminis]SFO04402.1 DNA-binding transcriptional regulator, MerR family [Proteiniclasticum ruminis]
MNKFTIGQMAKLNHISEQTLRLYDRMGLLKPCQREEDSGYRLYDIRQSARLDMIQYMKSLGMTLKDIKEQLEDYDIAHLANILQKRQAQIDFQMKELSCQKRAIERTLESFDRYENAPPDGTIVLEYLPKRKIYAIDTGINFYEYDLSVYEKMLRELKDSLISENLPQIYFCNAGSILRKDNLLSSRLLSTEVFVFVDEEFSESASTTTIAPSNYLCIYCDDFNKEKGYITRLLEEIKAKSYTITGDYLCEVIAEVPMIEREERSMYLKLQIPIKIR